MLGTVMGRLKGQWGEYISILEGVGKSVGKVVPYTGGTVVSSYEELAIHRPAWIGIQSKKEEGPFTFRLFSSRPSILDENVRTRNTGN